MNRSDAWTEFGDILRSEDEDIDLARAALLIASTEYPELRVERELCRIGALAEGVVYRFADEDDPLFHINTLSEYLFDEIQFRGNHDEYYDPRNSYLNDVLDRKLGIPITLALVYIEVGIRAGLPLAGVGMPGHFMVRHRDVPDLLIDPFNRGILLTEDECAQRLKEATRASVPWDAGYLTPISNREFIARMIRNLKAIYLRRHDYDRVLIMIDGLLLTQPHLSPERRDRGVVNYRLGNYNEALDDLEAYVESGPSVPDGGDVQRLIDQIHGFLEK